MLAVLPAAPEWRPVLRLEAGQSSCRPAAPARAATPELPRSTVDTTYVAPTGATLVVAAGGNLQAALDAAQPGDVITLQARGPLTRSHSLPAQPRAGRGLGPHTAPPHSR